MLLLRALLRQSQLATAQQRPLQALYGPLFAQTQIRTKKKKGGGGGKGAAATTTTAGGTSSKILDVRADVKGLIDLKKYDDSMRSTIESLKNNYARMRSGTVSPDFLDGTYCMKCK